MLLLFSQIHRLLVGLLYHNSRENPLDHLSSGVIRLVESVGISNHPTAIWSHHMAVAVVQKLSEAPMATAAMTIRHSEQTQQHYYTHTKSSQQAAEDLIFLSFLIQWLKAEKANDKVL